MKIVKSLLVSAALALSPMQAFAHTSSNHAETSNEVIEAPAVSQSQGNKWKKPLIVTSVIVGGLAALWLTGNYLANKAGKSDGAAVTDGVFNKLDLEKRLVDLKATKKELQKAASEGLKPWQKGYTPGVARQILAVEKQIQDLDKLAKWKNSNWGWFLKGPFASSYKSGCAEGAYEQTCKRAHAVLVTLAARADEDEQAPAAFGSYEFARKLAFDDRPVGAAGKKLAKFRKAKLGANEGLVKRAEARKAGKASDAVESDDESHAEFAGRKREKFDARADFRADVAEKLERSRAERERAERERAESDAKHSADDPAV